MRGHGGRGGPPTDLPALLAEEQRFLKFMALKLCRDETLATDLVQDTCLRALSHPPDELGNPRAWLTRIMHNAFIDMVRIWTRYRHEELDENIAKDDDISEPVPPWHRLALADIVDALGELDEPSRRTYELYEFEKRSYAQIALILGIEPQTVGTRLHRARRKLREILVRRHGIGR